MQRVVLNIDRALGFEVWTPPLQFGREDRFENLRDVPSVVTAWGRG